MYVTLSHDSHHSSIINLLRKIYVIMRYGVQLIFFFCATYILIKQLYRKYIFYIYRKTTLYEFPYDTLASLFIIYSF